MKAPPRALQTCEENFGPFPDRQDYYQIRIIVSCPVSSMLNQEGCFLLKEPVLRWTFSFQVCVCVLFEGLFRTELNSGHSSRRHVGSRRHAASRQVPTSFVIFNINLFTLTQIALFFLQMDTQSAVDNLLVDIFLIHRELAKKGETKRVK